MNDIRDTINLIDSLSALKESKGHLDHPEDLVFIDGASGARSALAELQKAVANPGAITLKFDGYPALIFGRGSDGKFSIMDKHMFNKKDGSGRLIHSPQDFKNYDIKRGANRSELHEIVNLIWKGLEKEDSLGDGYYWGDLLFRNPLQPSDGVYKFKANPNGITYAVQVDSEIGKLLTNKVAGIAVHQWIPAEGTSLNQAVSLNGSIGKLTNNSNVAIVPSRMPFSPQLKLDASQLSAVNKEIQSYGNAVDQLFDSAPQSRSTFGSLFTVYVNKKIVAGDLSNLLQDFTAFVQNRKMTDQAKAKVLQHLAANKAGLTGAFRIWIALYNLKMSLVRQLDTAAANSPVKGYLNDGRQTHEGFVSGNVKLIDRLGFSKQNLSNNS